MITSAHIEEAEQALARTYQIVAGVQGQERVMMRARVEPEAFNNLAQYHKDLLFKHYLPDVDPRQEPAIMTMLLHFFAVGAVAQRLADGKPA